MVGGRSFAQSFARFFFRKCDGGLLFGVGRERGELCGFVGEEDNVPVAYGGGRERKTE